MRRFDRGLRILIVGSEPPAGSRHFQYQRIIMRITSIMLASLLACVSSVALALPAVQSGRQKAAATKPISAKPGNSYNHFKVNNGGTGLLNGGKKPNKPTANRQPRPAH
jgi:hypothetical protein